MRKDVGVYYYFITAERSGTDYISRYGILTRHLPFYQDGNDKAPEFHRYENDEWIAEEYVYYKNTNPTIVYYPEKPKEVWITDFRLIKKN